VCRHANQRKRFVQVWDRLLTGQQFGSVGMRTRGNALVQVWDRLPGTDVHQYEASNGHAKPAVEHERIEITSDIPDPETSAQQVLVDGVHLHK
jgi:hypothetical protein